MNNKTQSEKLCIKPGLHIISSASLRGGSGRTAAILSTVCVCHRLGISVVILNLDPKCRMLEKNLSDHAIIRPDDDNLYSYEKAILKAEVLARNTKSLLLIDLPAGARSHSLCIEALQISGIRDRCDTFMAIVAMQPNQDGLKCAAAAIKVLNPDRSLLWVWDCYPSDPAPIEQWKPLNKHPTWPVKTWKASTRQIVARTWHPDLPPLTQLQTCLDSNDLSDIDRIAYAHAIDDVETTCIDPIYQYLLASITEGTTGQQL